ncbi:RING finger protein 24 isoform X2 [Silurus meridionalis]|uniref:RING finger protein 24 isoform X2 n=1 Tax=Silurus meridionalis TaxID=175797 RepID=UPI001EEB9B22|nr:RING finger protein 24 isoform X2 [Silurus meridionalis]
MSERPSRRIQRPAHLRDYEVQYSTHQNRTASVSDRCKSLSSSGKGIDAAAETKRAEIRICAVCLEEFKQKDELGICPCKHAFHRKCLIKWLEVRKVCPLCNMAVLQLAQQQGTTETTVLTQQPLPGVENLV